VRLIHALVWDEPPTKTRALQESLAFSGVLCAAWGAVTLTWWLRDHGWWQGLLGTALTVFPLAGLWLAVSLRLPHRDAPWRALLPGAFLVAIGFQLMHELVVAFLVPKLEKSTSLYGGLGAMTTAIFFIYLVGRLVVTAPVLNSSLHHELRETRLDGRDEASRPATSAGG
jgi:uncharacterized BrkB/YihY/UPF0761 family membrane protein